jgi:O-antigen/teichoic acid export membrane protein
LQTSQRIAKNIAALVISTIIILVSGFLYSMYTARYLGPERYGIISFALAFTAIFGVLTDLGLSQLTVREVARKKGLAEKYFGNVLFAKLVLGLATFAVVAVAINLMGYPATTDKVVYIIFLSIIIGALNGLFNSTFQAFERMEYQSISSVLNSISMLVAALFAITHNFDVIGFAYIYLISNLLVLAFNSAVSVHIHFRPRPEVDWTFLELAFKEALPFGLTGLLGMVYTYEASIILSFFQGNEGIGWYNAAYRLVLMLLFVPNIVNVVIYPVMSRFFVSSGDTLSFIYRRYFKYMQILAFPMGIGTTLLADRIILTIFGTGFTNSIIALRILIWTPVLTFFGAAFVNLLQATNRQAVITKMSAVCVVVNILTNLLLIPRFSYVGSSVATVITEVVLVGGIIFAASRAGYGIPLCALGDDLLKILTSCLIMSAFLMYFIHINLLILILSSGAVYFASIYLLRLLDNDDIMLIKQVMRLGRPPKDG